MRIPYGDLVLSGALGAGAQGTIYRAQPNPGFGLPFPLIYKEFSENTVVAGVSLELLARFRADLDEKDRAVLDQRTVWPAAVVVKAGRVCGYVMQEIPAPFMQTIETTSGPEPIPREVQHLFVADALARKNVGEVPNRTERLALARETAYVFGFLHKRELIFGDFSYKNAVYTLRPAPMVMLLDCDAVRRRGQGSAVRQLNSPGWAAPEKGPQTIESDRYKLGLFVLRCVTPGVNAQNRDPEKAARVLDREGMALLRRALGDDPGARPSGREWVVYLDAHIAGSGGVRTRTGTAVAPAPPPKVARRSFAMGGRRRTAPVATPGTAPTRGTRSRRARTAATARPTPSAPPPWPPPAGGFGSPRTSVRWPGLPTRAAFTPVFGTKTRNTTSRVVAVLLVLIIVYAGASALLSMSALPSGSRTGGTLATLPRSSGGTSGTSWPVEARPLAQAASTAAQIVERAAGPGWKAASVRSAAEAPPGQVDVRPTWVVDVVGPPSATAPDALQVRIYKIDLDGSVTLQRDTARPAGYAASEALGALWPVALEQAIARVLTMTPAGHAGPILVRYGCEPSAQDTSGCAWELRFLRSASEPVEVERAYVSADGGSSVAAPTWASAR